METEDEETWPHMDSTCKMGGSGAVGWGWDGDYGGWGGRGWGGRQWRWSGAGDWGEQCLKCHIGWLGSSKDIGWVSVQSCWHVVSILCSWPPCSYACHTSLLRTLIIILLNATSHTSHNWMPPVAVHYWPQVKWKRKEDHPTRSTITTEFPPFYSLCKEAYIAYQWKIHVVLLPVLKSSVE